MAIDFKDRARLGVRSTVPSGKPGAFDYHIADVEGMAESLRRSGEVRVQRIAHLLAELLLDSPEILIGTANEKEYLEVNEAFEYVLGWRSEDVVGKPWIELVVEQDRARTMAEVHRYRSMRRKSWSMINRIKTVDGGSRRLRWIVSEHDSEGASLFFAAIPVDECPVTDCPQRRE